MTIRKFCPNLLSIGLFWLINLAWLVTPIEAQEPPPTESPARFDPRFGIVDSFVNTTEANAAGAGWTRIFIRWDVVQPGGPSDWKPANVPDTFLEAEIAAGREIVAVLIGTPSWATANGTSTAIPPLEYWGDFVFKIATQYRGRINHWVIWNQPDVSNPSSPNHTWDGTEEDYFRLLKEAYFKIKTVDPTMQVHLAGLTYTGDTNRDQPPYLTRLLDLITVDPQAAEAGYFFDVVSYHLYYNPRQMLDANLAADEGKLRYLGQVAEGQKAILDLVQAGKPLEVVQLEERFTLRAMFDKSGQDATFLASYLYYFGMLTLAGETPQHRLRLEPPNLVVEKLYLDEVRQLLLPAGRDRTAADKAVLALLGNGDVLPLLGFVEEKIFKSFGKQDYLWMDEHALKAAFLVLLFDDVNYVTHSELELGRAHADLCLLRRPDRRAPELYDILLELTWQYE